MRNMGEKADWEKARDWLKQEKITRMSRKVQQPSSRGTYVIFYCLKVFIGLKLNKVKIGKFH